VKHIAHVRSLAVVALAIVAAHVGRASAADVIITDAAITGGRLVVTGTAPAGARVRLDGQTRADLNAIAGADGAFSIGAVYHPGDCIVSAQQVTGNALGAPVDALVAYCGPAGLTPRGAWNGSATYVANDIVTADGSAWRARRTSKGSPPASGRNWELFAGSGEDNDIDVAPTGVAGGELTGSYPNPLIANNVIDSANIRNSSVLAADLAPNAVTTTRIAPDTILAADIATGAVATAEIALNAVNAGRIAPLAVITSRLAANAVTSDKILDGTIAAADIATSAVNAARIAPLAVVNSRLAANAVTGDKILDETITGADIANGSLSGTDIANASITGDDIASHSVTQGDIDGTDHFGALGVGGISSGRCTTVTVSIGGALAGDAGVLTTDGTLPDGELMYLQRVLADQGQVKVCNLSGGDLPSVTVNVRIVTWH
jgi:hypothetical protein